MYIFICYVLQPVTGKDAWPIPSEHITAELCRFYDLTALSCLASRDLISSSGPARVCGVSNVAQLQPQGSLQLTYSGEWPTNNANKC